MTKQKFEIETDIPEGYEVEDFRLPKMGDTYLWTDCAETSDALIYGYGVRQNPSHAVIILRRALPPTLAVELPRAIVKWHADRHPDSCAVTDGRLVMHDDATEATGHACRAALVAEEAGR